MVQLIAYIAYSIYLVKKSKFEDAQNDLITEKVRWLKQFLGLLLLLSVLLGMSHLFFTSAEVDYWVAPLLYDIFYFWVVYKSFSSSGLFSDFTYNINIKEEVVSKERYSGSVLKVPQVEAYRQTLLEYMTAQEPYLNAELTLNKLSQDTAIPQHYLSQVINQEFGKNFFDFINTYRIDKAKCLMNEGAAQQLTLEAIGAQSGFGSPAAFYRAFKKHTGVTPSNFLKNASNSVI